MFRVTDIDLRLLRVFTAVVEYGGYAGAQTELNISQSTVSNHMSALEQRLGFRLCQRGRSGFRLTDKGETIYRETKQLLSALDNFSAAAGAVKGRLTGQLDIGVVDATITNTKVPIQNVVRRFNRRDNDVHINLIVQPRQELERAVLERRLHLAIGPFSKHIAQLHVQPLYAETQAVYCGKGHPFYERAPGGVKMEEIARAAFVARGYMRNFDSERLGGGRHCATVHNMEAQAILILSGGYIGYLPVHYAEDLMADGELRPVRPDRLSYESRFSLIRRRGPPATDALASFLQDLEAEFG